MEDQGKLPRREGEILVALVRRFIASGFPVASKDLAARMTRGLSSATVRHVLVMLEEGGFLVQPHTSAGRVPTDKAYRFYVDRAMTGARLGPETEHYIENALREDAGRLEALMKKASHALSEVSQNVGLVLAPGGASRLLEHVRFENLPDRRVLMVMVLKPDLVENRVVRLEEEFTQEELDQAANFLNTEFRGWSLGAIRLQVSQRVEADRSLCHRLLQSVGTLLARGALAEEESATLFVEGTARLVERPEFEDVEKIRHLLRALEEKARLAQVLAACLRTEGTGVRILIGRENQEKQMHDCALVVAPLCYRERAVGALGVVGPLRMEYDRAISAVDYVAHLCSRLLSSN